MIVIDKKNTIKTNESIMIQEKINEKTIFTIKYSLTEEVLLSGWWSKPLRVHLPF